MQLIISWCVHILESDCDDLDFPSLNMNRATPTTTSSTKKYFFNGYDLRPNSTPRIITGIGLPDLATTYNGMEIFYSL